MELLNLKAAVRDSRGKGAARQARRADKVPAILYGEAKEPLCLSVENPDLVAMTNAAGGEHAVVMLDVDGGEGGPALLKEIQHHPVKGTYLHADFQRIRLDKKIRTVVAIHITGRAKGVIEGGILDHQIRQVEVECLPTDVPDHIQVDVTPLEIGDGIHVSDLQVPEGVEITTPDHYAVAAVLASRLTRVGAEGLEEGEAAESEAGEDESGEEEGASGE